MRAQGIDFSYYQSSYDPSVKKHDFVIIRASYNVTKDRKFNQHSESIKDVPVRGAYHRFRSANAGHDPLFWQAQADYFLNVVNDFDFNFYVLDFERKYNTPSIRFGLGAKQWIDYVAEQSGKRVLLYSNPASYQEFLLHYGQQWMNSYPFWIAQYPYDRVWNEMLESVFSIFGGWEPRLPAGHTDWKFWQFSADGNRKGPENGIPRMPWHEADPAVDIDVFNGTFQELLDWLNLEEPVNDIEQPVDQPPIVEPTYVGLTNQGLINLILVAAEQLGNHYWDHWVTNAQLEYLAIPDENRTKPYTGPVIEDLPGLTENEKEMLLSLI
jgi:GH25 family lysozyme M1 (1,4-beta-N-acetylmuramidase)